MSQLVAEILLRLAKVGAATKRIRVCTSCLRSGKVVKA